MSALLKRALSLESEAKVDDDVTEAEELQTELEVEQAAGEVAEAEHEVEMSELQVEELEAAEETLEAICLSLESAISDGLLTKQAATGYHLAMRSVLGDAIDNPISLESFSGTDTELAEAGTLSLEKAKDVAKQVGQAIKNAVARLWQAVKDMFTKIFGGTAKLKARAEQLMAAVKKLDSKDKPKEKVKVVGGSRLHMDGKMDADSIAKGVADMYKLVGDIGSTAMTAGEEILAALRADGERAVLREAKYANDIKKFNGASLPGGKTAITIHEKSQTNFIAPKIGNNNKFGEYADAQEVDAADGSKLTAILNNVIAGLVQLDKSKKDVEEYEKLSKRVAEEINKDQDFAARLKNSIDIRVVRTIASPYMAPFTSLQWSVYRAAVNYVDAHVKAYGGKAPAAEGDGKAAE